MQMVTSDPWIRFKTDPNPVARVREVKEALPEGPGLMSYYEEIRATGTLLGVPVIRQSRSIFLPRQRIVAVVEGRG
jgi:hypothetical protein